MPTVSCAVQGRSWVTWSVCWEETSPPAPALLSPPTTRCPSPRRPARTPGPCLRAPAQVQLISCHGCYLWDWFERILILRSALSFEYITCLITVSFFNTRPIWQHLVWRCEQQLQLQYQPQQPVHFLHPLPVRSVIYDNP